VPLLGIKPDLNPLVANMQGIAKLDCVTVWLTCKNKKMMVSLSLTPERDGGVYTREDPPTTTFNVLAGSIDIWEIGYSQYAWPLVKLATRWIWVWPQPKA
jgi:hypothetical protein